MLPEQNFERKPQKDQVSMDARDLITRHSPIAAASKLFHDQESMMIGNIEFWPSRVWHGQVKLMSGSLLVCGIFSHFNLLLVNAEDIDSLWSKSINSTHRKLVFLYAVILHKVLSFVLALIITKNLQFSWDPRGGYYTERQRTDDMLSICVFFLEVRTCVTQILWIVSKLMQDHPKDSVVTYSFSHSSCAIWQLSVDQVRGGRNLLYNMEFLFQSQRFFQIAERNCRS
jgi:hypothetical protein